MEGEKAVKTEGGAGRWVMEGASQFIMHEAALMSSFWRERGSLFTGCSKLQPKERCSREHGRLSEGWMNLNPKERWVSDCGRLSAGLSKEYPKPRSLKEERRMEASTGWLKSCLNTRCVREEAERGTD